MMQFTKNLSAYRSSYQSAYQLQQPDIAAGVLRFLVLFFAFVPAFLLSACVSTGDATVKNDTQASQFNAELGAKYLQRGELDQAREKLEKSLQQDPDNATAHINYARLQQNIKQYDLAAVHFEKALQLEPDQSQHRNSYGVFLCETGRTTEAVEQFRLAAENPFYKTPEFALDNAGLCLMDAQQLNEAETYLRDALRRNPRFANALLHMADLTLKQQRLQFADAYFGRFQQYSQDTPQSLVLGMNIKKAQGDANAAKAFRDRLLSEFPQSREASELF